MTLFSRWLASGVFLAASLLPVATPTDACAGEGARAALVVDTGDQVHRYCVALPEGSVSGTELIVLAGEQHGLAYRFGYGGDAVCMLAGVGTESDDCFERYPDFWGYWRGDGSGGWAWSGTGAGSSRVSDGDVEGWSWGSGSDGSSHPAPPSSTFPSVCPSAARPRPQPDPEDQTRPRARTEPVGAGDSDDEVRRGAAAPVVDDTADAQARHGDGRARPPERARDSHGKRRRPDREARRASASPPPSVAADREPQQATRPVSETSDRPPAAGVAALVAAGALGGAGTWFTRRRRSRP